MAELNTGAGGGHGGKHNKKRAKKLSTRVDMTPMVDLAFLLLTFFVLTATFNKNRTTDLLLPAPPVSDAPPPKVKDAITLIADKEDKLYYYEGELGNLVKDSLFATDYSKTGVFKLLKSVYKTTQDSIALIEKIATKENWTKDSINTRARKISGNKNNWVVLIKFTEDAPYRNIVRCLDMVKLNKITKFVLVDSIDPKEVNLIKQKQL